MKKMFNKRFLGVLFIIATLTLLVSATCFAVENDPEAFLRGITNTIRGVAVVFIALAAVLVAVMFMLGAANPKWKTKSKDALYALIIGVIVLVLSNDIGALVANMIAPNDTVTNEIITEKGNS